MRTEYGMQKSGAVQKGTSKFLAFILCSVFCFLLLSPVYAADTAQKPPLQFTKNQEIQQVKPKKPVRIKLHRNAKGEYSWELSGDTVDEVVRADSRLRKLLKVEEGQK